MLTFLNIRFLSLKKIDFKYVHMLQEMKLYSVQLLYTVHTWVTQSHTQHNTTHTHSHTDQHIMTHWHTQILYVIHLKKAKI